MFYLIWAIIFIIKLYKSVANAPKIFKKVIQIFKGVVFLALCMPSCFWCMLFLMYFFVCTFVCHTLIFRNVPGNWRIIVGC